MCMRIIYIYIYVYFMRMQPQLPNEHIVITRHNWFSTIPERSPWRSIIYPNLRAHSNIFPTNYNSMLFPSNPPWDSYSHFLILFQDFQGTWGAPDSTSWSWLAKFFDDSRCRCWKARGSFLFFSVRHRPTPGWWLSREKCPGYVWKWVPDGTGIPNNCSLRGETLW